MLLPASRQPPQRPLHPLLGQLPRRAAGDHVVERHRDIGAEVPLDLGSALGSEPAPGAIHVAPELDPALRDGAELLQAEDLEAAAVGEHRPLPAGEAMQPAHVADDGLAGTEMEMVAVAED